jgi:hypothetical protein
MKYPMVSKVNREWMGVRVALFDGGPVCVELMSETLATTMASAVAQRSK